MNATPQYFTRRLVRHITGSWRLSFRQHSVVAAILLTVASSASAANPSEPTTERKNREAQAIQMASQLMQVTDVVLEKHLRPQTRQQMILGSIQRAYQLRERPMPGSMPEQVSDANSTEELQALLTRELIALNHPKAGAAFQIVPNQLDQIGVQVTPLKAQRVNEQLAANRYVGIGIAIMKSGEYPEMAKVMPGGAADLAECQKGDAIVCVDKRNTSGAPLTAVIDLLRGPEGTTVDITIRRGTEDRILTMTRGVVPMKTIGKAVQSKSGMIAGVAIDRVSASNVHELRQFADTLDDRVKTVVLDLRTSQDATILHYGKLLGNALIDDDDIGQVITRDGASSSVRAEPGALFVGRELRVLIGQQTGPVLKWVAAALQDTNSAILMGLPASAPCVVADVIDLPEASLAITIPSKRLARHDGSTLFPPRSNMNPMFAAPQTPIANHVRTISPGVLQPDEPIDSRPVKNTSRYIPQRLAPMPNVDQPLERVIQRLDERKTESDPKSDSEDSPTTKNEAQSASGPVGQPDD